MVPFFTSAHNYLLASVNKGPPEITCGSQLQEVLQKAGLGDPLSRCSRTCASQRSTFAPLIGLVGGGRWPRPGEISLSHRGVLFLDELPEFGQTDLDVLRQPMEDKVVTISRALGSVTFPANFMLVCWIQRYP